MQSKEELEQWYVKPDPWAYQTTKDDLLRKNKILELISSFGLFERAIDIGCGEGWITKDLPAKEIHGIELSDNASSRFPSKVTKVSEPVGKYDLVCTMGTLYIQYDHKQIIDWILSCSSKYIFIAGIKDWLIPNQFGKLISFDEFKYREYTQLLRLYETST